MRSFLWPWSCGEVPPPAPVVTPTTVAPRVRPAPPKPWRSGLACSGLCPGDCSRCEDLADRITGAKALPEGRLREELLGLLAVEVDAVMGRTQGKEDSR